MKSTDRFMSRRWMVLSLAAALIVTCSTRADLARDAGKTAIVGEEGAWTMENAFQLEREKRDLVWSLEVGLQYVPERLSRVSFLVEPVLWERDAPRGERAVEGSGDTDVTAAFLLLPGAACRPALVAAGKVKIPTARKRQIGTGATDYSAIAIVGREFGELDLNLELEFATFGRPEREPSAPEPSAASGEEEDELKDEGETAPEEGDRPRDQFLYTLSADYGVTEHLSVFAEVFGNTRVSREERASIAAGLGLECDMDVTEYANVFVQADVDTDKQTTVKTGVEWNW